MTRLVCRTLPLFVTTLFIVGCANVTVTSPIGENVSERVSGMDGAWQVGDVVVYVKSLSHGMTVIAVPYWDDGKFRVRELTADVKRFRDENYLVIDKDDVDEQDGADPDTARKPAAPAAAADSVKKPAEPRRFLIYKSVKSEDADHAKLVPMHAETIADAVRKGTLSGTVKTGVLGTTVDVTSKAEDLEAFIGANPKAFDDEHAVTVAKVGRLVPKSDAGTTTGKP
jgi:hypothetical protein